ncbi:MAG: hypothetical protein JWR44_2662 [Hymenobacter sp.]|jgi:hypothetical protein|nr:hypothetical protein [Hymenobacter sp.]
MHLLYLVFGPNIHNHIQANFSILTFLRQRADVRGVTVVTDTPTFYQHLAEAVTVLPVEAEQLKEWEGEFGFFWRVKIKALEHVARQLPGVPLVYLDSDTFMYGSLPEMARGLAQGQAYMHEPEGLLSALGSKTEQRMWAQTKDQTFGGVRITAQHAMWNAGVVGIPAERAAEAIDLALRICDDLCRAKVTPRLIEQFALSVALAETYGLLAARAYIGHYWSNKDEWSIQIAAFQLESHLKNRSLAEELVALSAFDFTRVPVKKKLKNTRYRLERLVGKLFPPKEVEYVGQ